MKTPSLLAVCLLAAVLPLHAQQKQEEAKQGVPDGELRFSVRIEDHGYGVRTLEVALFSGINAAVGMLTLRLNTAQGFVDCINDQPVWKYEGEPGNVAGLPCLAVTTPASLKDIGAASATVTDPDKPFRPTSYRCRENARSPEHLAIFCNPRDAVK